MTGLLAFPRCPGARGAGRTRRVSEHRPWPRRRPRPRRSAIWPRAVESGLGRATSPVRVLHVVSLVVFKAGRVAGDRGGAAWVGGPVVGQVRHRRRPPASARRHGGRPGRECGGCLSGIGRVDPDRVHQLVGVIVSIGDGGRTRKVCTRTWPLRATRCSAARQRSKGMFSSSTRHQRSSPCCWTAGSGGGSVRTANTSWSWGSSASMVGGIRNVRTRTDSRRPAWHIAARQAATGMSSSVTRRLATPVRLNSVTSRIIGLTPVRRTRHHPRDRRGRVGDG